jgi:RNA polymerase sigma-70 factor (ECF subfamily)
MDASLPAERLSQIATNWTLVMRAHAQPPHHAAQARRALVERYAGAVRRYLLGAVRDQEVASDLFQEFALRVLGGGFHGADRVKGRFRSYVKTALAHLIADHWRRVGAAPVKLPPELSAPALAEDDPDFLSAWRRDLMDHAWAALKNAQPALYEALLAHVQDPALSSAGAATLLTQRLGRPCTAPNARVLLHRGREKFVDLLVDEVERSLPGCSEQDLSDELRELRLGRLCESAIRRRRAARGSAA